MDKIVKRDENTTEIVQPIRVSLVIPIADILEEVQRAEELHGPMPKDKMRAMAILTEEVGEAAAAALEVGRVGIHNAPQEARIAHYREELVHAAAVALRMIEVIDGE